MAEIAERANANRGWLVFPNREVARIGDNFRSGDPLQSASTTRMIAGREFAVGDFSRSGYAIVRSIGPEPVERQSMLFMTAMHHNQVHKHADDLSFELFEAGERILIDSGRYDFQWDSMRRYVFSAAAHNTVDLLDEPIITKHTEPYGSGLRPIRVDDDAFILSGRVRRARKFDHTRTLRYRPGASLTIEDVLESSSQRQYVGRLHCNSKLTVRAEGDRYAISDRHQEVIGFVEPPAGATINLVRGQENPLLGWETVGRREMAPAYVLEALCPGKNVRMTWRISFRRSEERLRESADQLE